MSNNELIDKIVYWADNNYLQEQNWLYGPQGPRYIRLYDLKIMLNLFKIKE